MNKKDIKVLLVPDVHGRTFWKESVMDILENYPDARVVFLGDYLDPYVGYEDDVSKEGAFNMFTEEILPLKEKYGNRVSLLLGNHDLGYYNSEICSCRSDRVRRKDVETILKDNWNKFAIADEETINGKHFIFSHAGIHKDYAERCFGEDINEANVVDYFNNAFLIENYGIMDSLGIYSYYRGWGGYEYGSLIWADIREWFDEGEDEDETEESVYGFQIFGHTRLDDDRIGKPIVTDSFAMIDCRAIFYIDSEGILRRYDDDEIMEMKKGQEIS